MTNFRRMFRGAALIVLASGLASADLMTATYMTSTGNMATDINGVALSLPQFNVAGATLTGVQLEMWGTLDVSSLTITNHSFADAGVNAYITSELYTLNNSASGDLLDTDPNQTPPANDLILYNNSDISLGTTATLGNVPCVGNTPSPSCTTFTLTNLVVSDLNSPVITTVAAANFGGYEGSGTFGFNAYTNSGSVIIGGGGNLDISQVTQGDLTFEVIYTYTTPGPPGVPEPASAVLMVTALFGVGLLRKRLKN